MKPILSNILMFAAGAAVGAFVTWRYLETKCEQKIRDEISEIKERYCVEKKTIEEDEFIEDDDVPFETEEPDDSDVDTYKELITNNNYVNYADSLANPNNPRPKIITPEEFGDIDEYDTATYTYYSDGVLTDDMDEPVDDIDDVVGEDSLTHFGEYEDDCVYVRNDDRACDYEILRDLRPYSEVDPFKRSDETEE